MGDKGSHSSPKLFSVNEHLIHGREKKCIQNCYYRDVSILHPGTMRNKLRPVTGSTD